ncbi:hypothetical protein SATMO3_31020 [Sporomusa aerivorans]
MAADLHERSLFPISKTWAKVLLPLPATNKKNALQAFFLFVLVSVEL